MSKYKILHLTPHLGGGVGSVVTKYLTRTKTNKRFQHALYSLEYINENAKTILEENNTFYKEKVAEDYTQVLDDITSYDILLIHWWNHPLLYEFLTKFTLNKCRVIMWSHISGLYSPSNFVRPLFSYADKFVFTTPVSCEADILKKLPNNQKDKISVIWSTTGVTHLKNLQKHREDSIFTVGYLGTVDYSKLHIDFLEMSKNIKIDNIEFIVCGGSDEKKIEQEAKNKNIASKFRFTGKVSNIQQYLCKFDIFGYPLSPYHFGTCDQVLAEAMACGIVPVVFNNPMENYIIKHLETGLIVKNQDEYVKAIEMLYKDKALRMQLSQNAKDFAHEYFSIEKMIEEWDQLLDKTLNVVPTTKKWEGKYQGTEVLPYQIFLESTGDKSLLFEQLLNTDLENNALISELLNKLNLSIGWKSSSKGSLNHYNSVFDDNMLRKLKKILDIIAIN